MTLWGKYNNSEGKCVEGRPKSEGKNSAKVRVKSWGKRSPKVIVREFLLNVREARERGAPPYTASHAEY